MPRPSARMRPARTVGSFMATGVVEIPHPEMLYGMLEQFRMRGMTVESAALPQLERLWRAAWQTREAGDDEAAEERWWWAWTAVCPSGSLTVGAVKEVERRLRENGVLVDEGEESGGWRVQVADAFQCAGESVGWMFPAAAERTAAVHRRHALLLRELRWMGPLEENTLVADTAGGLVPVQALMSEGGRRAALGWLSRRHADEWWLEDASGAVRLQWTTNAGEVAWVAELAAEKQLVGEGGFAVVEGVYHASASALAVERLRAPPLRGLPAEWHGRVERDAAARDDDIVAHAEEDLSTQGTLWLLVVADVHLDDEETLRRLQQLLRQVYGGNENGARTVSADAAPQCVFVLCGPFLRHGADAFPAADGEASYASQHAHTDSSAIDALTQACARLGAMVRAFQPALRASRSQWVLVPAASDPGGIAKVLPRPPLPSSAVAAFCAHSGLSPNSVHAAANPCRLHLQVATRQHGGGDVAATSPATLQVLVHRTRLLARQLARHALLPPGHWPCARQHPDAEHALTAGVFCTLLSQRHLCPLPFQQQPLFWELDARALSTSAEVDGVCRPPDVLLLADDDLPPHCLSVSTTAYPLPPGRPLPMTTHCISTGALRPDGHLVGVSIGSGGRSVQTRLLHLDAAPAPDEE